MAQQPWERYELDFIVEVAGKMPLAVIAEKLERTPNSIKNKAAYLGLSLALERETKAWTPDESALFLSKSNNEISLITGRSIKSVVNKRYALGVQRRAA